MKILNLFGKSVVSMAVVVATCGGAFAAQNGRDGAQGSQSGRVGMMAARMPTIPTSGLTVIGNPAVSVINQPVQNLPTIVPTPTPTPDPTPTPVSDCEDGGVRNSDYTVENCMNDISQCINNGAVPGGLPGLFCDENVRHGIMNGMMLCQSNIDRCIRSVRVDCRNIYTMSTDVWLDFNSRVIQPEYYNFVLRKTGLTPNQAENTCLLLDRNTYGSSFASVSDANMGNLVNAEYNNRVGAYNGANGGTLSKDNPQGVAVNTVGYDGNRGHYARWDACNAECLIRVAAYNKDDLITNTWLFGAMGNDEPAEVWQKAGATFTCSKDLFDMSLMNDTKTAAVVGIGGGTLLGAGTGAVIAAANYDDDPEICNNKDSLDKLSNYFRTHVEAAGTISTYLDGADLTDGVSADECVAVRNLWKKIAQYEAAIKQCKTLVGSNEQVLNYPLNGDVVMQDVYNGDFGRLVCTVIKDCDASQTIVTANASNTAKQCLFKSLVKIDDDVLCSGTSGNCVNANTITEQISNLKRHLSGVEPILAVTKNSKGSEVAKGALIGGATGAGVGGIVTGITALVERSNITCKVGDGLNTVALGKSHKIDTLKDFYVKWGLRLPDAVSPTSAVSDMASWQQACGQFNGRLDDCPNVQINLVNGNGYDLVSSACVVSGSICIVNMPVAQSHGIQ